MQRTVWARDRHGPGKRRLGGRARHHRTRINPVAGAVAPGPEVAADQIRITCAAARRQIALVVQGAEDIERRPNIALVAFRPLDTLRPFWPLRPFRPLRPFWPLRPFRPLRTLLAFQLRTKITNVCNL